MEEGDSITFRNLLKGHPSTNNHTLPSKYRFHRPLNHQHTPQYPTAEDRDDAEGTKTQRKQKSVDYVIEFHPEGIIHIEIPRESIPGITFARPSVEAPLQIAYVHPDSLFSSTPLVPGLIVAKINHQEMTYKSPREAQDELVNDSCTTTSVHVHGYVGKMYKATKANKIGLVLKDSTVLEGVFISNIKPDSMFQKTGLRIGLQVLAINKRPCPTEIVKAIKRLQKTTGDLEIVAIDPKQHHKDKCEEVNVQDGEKKKPLCKEGQDYSKIELSTHVDPPEQVLPLGMAPFDAVLKESREENNSRDERHVEPQISSDDLMDQDTQPEVEVAQRESTVVEPSSNATPTGARTTTSTEGRAFLDEVAEFVDDHKAMLDKLTRRLFGDKLGTALLGERNSEKWRVIDIRRYSKIENLPAVVTGVIGLPTSPMLLSLPPTSGCSTFCNNMTQNQHPLITITLPEEPLPHDVNQEEIFYDAACTVPQNRGEIVESEPGIVIMGIEMAFRHKAVFVAKKTKHVKNATGHSMALFLVIDNVLVSFDKMCF
jgi:hypothetical protein